MLAPLFQAVGLPQAHNSASDAFESLVASKIRDGFIDAWDIGNKLKVPPDMPKTRDYLLEHGWRFKEGYFFNDKQQATKRLQNAVIARNKQAAELKAAADVRITQIQEMARQGELFIPQADIDHYTELAKRDFNRNKVNLGIDIEWNDEIAFDLRSKINEDYRKDFAGFTERQAEEIRQWVHEAYIGGNLTKKAAADYFAKQYDISNQRAKFWARQELNLMLSTLKTEQMNAAGFRYYIWRAIDEPGRTRPDHLDLDGSVQDTYNPPIVDKRSGRRGNPKEDFNCRCYAEFITEEQYNDMKNGLM